MNQNMVESFVSTVFEHYGVLNAERGEAGGASAAAGPSAAF